MEILTVKGEKRANAGTKFARADRKAGLIPCVVYGSKGNTHFTTIKKEVKSLVYTPDFKLAEVEIDGAKKKCILKDIQFHPVTDEIMHIDFLELTDGHSVKVELPVRFKGVSPGVKEGGTLMQNMRRVKVKVTPEHLVDELILDVSKLELGSAIRVRDIQPVEGVEVMSAGATPVAVVEVPRALKSETAAEAAVEGSEGASAATAE